MPERSRISGEKLMIYQIKIQGQLEKSWSDWLGDVKITSDIMEDSSVVTTLTLDTTDQPALFGILDHIRDLNLILLSVSRDGI
jgi:hypothetical protein